jgi:hypothetical protein
VKTPEQELRAILERGEAAAAKLMRGIVDDVKPADDRSVTIKFSSIDKVDDLRKLYDELGKRVARVSGGGKAKDQLLAGVRQFEEGLAQFSLAAQITYSTEQIEAFEAAGHSLKIAMRKLRKSYNRLEK